MSYLDDYWESTWTPRAFPTTEEGFQVSGLVGGSLLRHEVWAIGKREDTEHGAEWRNVAWGVAQLFRGYKRHVTLSLREANVSQQKEAGMPSGP